MRRFFGPACVASALAAAAAAAGVDAAAPVRVEARSDSLLTVGVVSGDHMSIHITRLLDNAPVRDAVVTVVLRGTAHPTLAEADGSYSLESKDLQVPGSAAVDFRVARTQSSEDGRGTLVIAAGSSGPQDKNSARQLWWWVLNFAVCIGFLKLWASRRKTVAED